MGMCSSSESDRIDLEDVSSKRSEVDLSVNEDSGLKLETRPAEASECQKYRRAKASESIRMSGLRGYTIVRV